ncbi:MAG: aldose 1-epimerase family protein [Planctomycetota bacterium]
MPRWNLIHRPSPFGPNPDRGNADTQESLPKRIDVDGGVFGVDWSAWPYGKSMGMKCLTLDTGLMRTVILPERGMGIWKSQIQGIEFGWQSPVCGPVHPALVPIGDPSGIGWLEGFDELLVRCGLLSNGAPEFDERGQVRYPVHGRIANLPCHELYVESQPELGFVEVVGKVMESRFLVYALELETRYRFYPNRGTIEILDTVTNPLTTPGSMQLLYHINLGQPVLQAGSRIVAALDQLAPRDARASEDVDAWDICQGPEDGFREQVYYSTPLVDEHDWTEAMLTNHDSTLGYSVQFDARTLPCVNFWKNTAGVEDGYVLGIEPASGFPNTKSYEERHGRVMKLQGGQSRMFRLKLNALSSASEVQRAAERIRKLQSRPCSIDLAPRKGWSPAAS